MRTDDQPTAGAPPAAGADLLGAGTMVDHFCIMRPLGRGGMGQVYLARDTKLGRKVALKLIRAELVGRADALQRFLFEARATARFAHPHIVTIFAVGEHGGSPYVALEYLEGQTLRERLGEGLPGSTEALRFGAAVSDALAEAHRHQILHRDLKPENVIIARDGRLRVLDFGLAKVGAEEAPGAGGVATVSSADGTDTIESPAAADLDTQEAFRSGGFGIRGTPPYMAPEQWTQHECTEKTDVWALGVMLHEMLSGHRPYEEKSMAVLSARVCAPEPVPPLRDAPAELADLVAACLAKDPAARPTAAVVAEALARLIHRERARPAPEQSPFRGLLPFDERHADLFFGRDAEVAAFLERLRGEAVLTVVGPSGAGKSSFVQAGVVPRLREQGRWHVMTVRPGSQPFTALGAALLGADQPPTTTSPGNVLRLGPFATPPAVPASPAELVRLAGDLAGAAQRLQFALRAVAARENARVLLFVDQLEEVYTLVDDPEVRRRFLQAVFRAADDRQEPVRVVCTLRDDFLGRVAEEPEVREALSRVAVLRSPGAAALHEILTRPLAAVGHAYDDETLVADMTRAVAGEAACLPLLQFVAEALWERRDPERRLLVRAAYEAMGGVAGALATHADSVIAELTPEEVRLARELLLRLVTPEGTRRRLPQSQILEGLPPAAADVLMRLVRARLLHARKARGAAGSMAEHDEPELELVHESLIRTWSQLRRWVEAGREEMRLLQEVRAAAELWHRRGRREEEAWQGAALREAQRNLERVGVVPPLVADFVAAGAHRAGRLRRRRRLLAASGIALLAFVAVAAVVVAVVVTRQEQVALRERARAEHGRAEGLCEGSRAATERGDPMEARSKLRASLELEGTLAARALWARLQRDPRVWSLKVGTAIMDMAPFPDGQRLLAGGPGGATYILDVHTGQSRFLRGHTAEVLAVAVSDDGRFAAASASDGVVRLWDLEKGTVRTARLGAAAARLRFSADGSRLVALGNDRTILLWDPAAGVETRRRVAGRPGRALAISPDGALLAYAVDEKIVLERLPAATPAHVLVGHTGLVVGVTFSPDGRLLASFGKDDTMRMWEVATGRELRSHKAPSLVRDAIAFSPDGNYLAAGAGGEVWIWDVQTGARRGELSAPDGSVGGLGFSADGEILAFADDTGTVHFGNWRRPGFAAPPPPQNEFQAVAFSPDGRLLASAGADRSLRLWDVATGGQVARFLGHTKGVLDVVFSPDGSLLASGSHDGTVRVRDVESGVQLRILSGHQGGAWCLAFSPDGSFLASGSEDGMVRRWNAHTGTLERAFKAHGHVVFGLAVSPDSRLIASGAADSRVRLWDARTGAAIWSADSPAPVRGVSFSPDGRTLATGHINGDVWLWDVRRGTGHRLGNQGPGLRVMWLSFHPDGRHLGVPGTEGVAQIWDLTDGSRVTLPIDAKEMVNEFVFSPDGRLAATASDDGTVRLWDARTGRPVWRAPVLLAAPPRIVSHRGWTRLDGREPPQPSVGAWQRAVADRGRAGATSPTHLCLRTYADHLEVWDTRTDRLMQDERIPGLAAVVAYPGGCLSLAAGEVRAHTLGGDRRTLAADASAVAWDDGQVLVASGGQVLALRPGGARAASVAVEPGVSALGRVAGRLVLGHRDGSLEVIGADGARAPAPTLEGKLKTPVTAIAAGPAGTLLAAHMSGAVGLWDVATGTRLDSWSLHGPVRHLLVEADRLYAVSELGDVVTADLGVLRRPYCDLLREVWASAPATWEGGRAERRPPPARHPCLTGSAR